MADTLPEAASGAATPDATTSDEHEVVDVYLRCERRLGYAFRDRSLLRMDDQDGFYRCDRMPNPPGGG